MNQTESDRIADYLRPTVTAAGLFLEAVDIKGQGKDRIVQVLVDYEEGTQAVTLDEIAEVSQAISTALDADTALDQSPYELEVSTPGVSRPLTEPRHWRRNVGRTVRVNVMGQDNLSGELTQVSETGITIIPTIEPPKKGMKAKRGEPQVIDFANIRRGNVEIDFSAADKVSDEDLEALDEEDLDTLESEEDSNGH